MLQLDIQQIISQAVSFLLLLWVLKRFAWRPLLSALDARRARIEEGFRKIAEGQAQLERVQRELNARLAKIDEEARAKIQQAILEGKRIAVEVQEHARTQAQAIVEKSKETIEQELRKARVSLRDELADMTVEAVERILKQKLDAKSDEQLVASILDELGQSPKPDR